MQEPTASDRAFLRNVGITLLALTLMAGSVTVDLAFKSAAQMPVQMAENSIEVGD